MLKDFVVDVSVTRGIGDAANVEKESLSAEIVTPGQILNRSAREQTQLEEALSDLFQPTFPDEQDWRRFLWCYFHEPMPGFQRQGILLWNPARQLVATTIVDHGWISYQGYYFTGIYDIVVAVLPAYQGKDLAKIFLVKFLQDLQPDILMATSAQASSFYSLLRVANTLTSPQFEVFPRFETVQGVKQLITFPTNQIDFAIQAFTQLYAGFAQDKREWVERAIRNMTVLLARKNINVTYHFHPWAKHGELDPFAQALGLTEKDGILVILKKIPEASSAGEEL